ncbi:MAG: sensor histidine kinase [Flavobacteriales bacterium]
MARWFRHTEREREAYQKLDSLKRAIPSDEAYIRYLIDYQIAKTLVKLGLLNEALGSAHAAVIAARKAGLSHEALNMQVTACEIHLDTDELHEAQQCLEIALEQARKEHDDANECRSLIAMGNLYYQQEKDEDALRLYNAAFAVAKLQGDPGLLTTCLLNIGAALSFTAGADSAILLYRSVLDTMKTGRLEPQYRADLLGNMASMYSDEGLHDKALLELDRVLDLYTALHDTAGMARTHLYRATALWESGRREDAVEQTMLAIARSRSLGLKAEATRKASDFLAALGDATASRDLLNRYCQLADSLARSRYNSGVAGAQVRFETAEKERRIVEQDQALTLAAEQDRRKSTQRNAFIVATALLALIALLLYRAMRNRQRLARKEKELHDEQVDQLLSQQEMKSINAMLEGQEQERERVSKELHDHVGSLLGAIKHQLGELEEQVADVKSEQSAQYRKVTGLLDNAAGELRRISHDMAAATLNRFGLEKALKDLRDTIHINGRLQVELNTFGLEKPLERGVEIAVYRIVQEAVSNVLKHAEASELSIAVTHAPGRLSVLVGDNGTGFDTTATSSGVGLTNIRSRAAALGAQVQIDSTPGKGTTVSVECPVVG